MNNIDERLKSEEEEKKLTQEWLELKAKEKEFQTKRKEVETKILEKLNVEEMFKGTINLANNMKLACSRKKVWDFEGLLKENLLGSLNDMFFDKEAPFKIEIKEVAKNMADFAMNNSKQYEKIFKYSKEIKGARSFSEKK